jgi:hypothetical protein
LKKRRSAKVGREKWQTTETKICVFTVSASTTDRKIAEPGFKMDSPDGLQRKKILAKTIHG